MQDTQVTETNAPVDDSYRKQIEQSIANLSQQLFSEETMEGRASIEDKIDKLRLELSKPSETPREISITRIMHLEDIFKHYCTHIFRVGKHMTFDRLEYEKTHMAMDRFFKFLQDFSLTTFMYEGKQRELVPKHKLISIFKRVSSTSKDLNFEEFIECLEKIGVVYYDEKERYADRLKEEDLRKKKLKEALDRKKRMAAKSIDKTKEASPEKADNADGLDGAEPSMKEPEDEKEPPAENDDLVNDMMKNPNKIEDPTDEIDKEIKDKQEEIQQKAKSLKKLESQPRFDEQESPSEQQEKNEDPATKEYAIISKPLPIANKVSTQEKVELFYKMIGVDNIRDYRNKLSELGHPLFKLYENRTQSTQNTSESQKNLDDEESMRLQMIKEKINEQKALSKNQTPKKMTPAEENEYQKMQEQRRQRMEKKKERLERAKKLKEDESQKNAELQQQFQKNEKEKKKVEPRDINKAPPVFKENSVTFDGIEKLNFEQLNMKSFHPHSLYNLEPEDEEFMGDLKFDAKNLQRYKQMNRVRQRKDDKLRSSVAKGQVQKIAEIKEKKTQAVVENTKKRASELQKSEKNKEKNMDDKTRRLSEAKTPRTKLKV